jgi:hypothetical protein
LGKFWDFSGTELDNCFDVSSDGKFIFAPDKDNPCWLRILDTEEKLKLKQEGQHDDMIRNDSSGFVKEIILKKHTNEIKAVKLIEKLKLIITAGKDNMILLWHLDKHYLVRPPLYDRHYDFVSSMQIIKNTGYLLTGGNDKCLNIFDVSSNFNLFNRMKTNFKIRTLRASKDGRFVISGGQNSQVVQIVSTKFLISKLKKHEPVKKSLNDSFEDSFGSVDDNKILNNASMINNKKFGTDMEYQDSVKNKSMKNENMSNFLSIIECSGSKMKERDYDLADVPSFSIPKKKKIKRSNYINQEFDRMIDIIQKNPSDIDFKPIRSELLNHIEEIKSKLFDKELNKFWEVSVSKLKEKEANKSIFFHDYKVRRKTEDLSTLNLNMKKMFEKYQNDKNKDELRLDFHSILKTMESFQPQLSEVQRKGSLNDSLDIYSVPNLERQKNIQDVEKEEQELLKKCISFLQSKLKE